MVAALLLRNAESVTCYLLAFSETVSSSADTHRNRKQGTVGNENVVHFLKEIKIVLFWHTSQIFFAQNSEIPAVGKFFQKTVVLFKEFIGGFLDPADDLSLSGVLLAEETLVIFDLQESGEIFVIRRFLSESMGFTEIIKEEKDKMLSCFSGVCSGEVVHTVMHPVKGAHFTVAVGRQAVKIHRNSQHFKLSQLRENFRRPLGLCAHRSRLVRNDSRDRTVFHKVSAHGGVIVIRSFGTLFRLCQFLFVLQEKYQKCNADKGGNAERYPEPDLAAAQCAKCAVNGRCHQKHRDQLK